jgi:site-specific recombinase XerD|tara:strand:- start:3407 stop:4243 length:837 start_codon:yes stop_codon:yes gene_type:complete
MNTNTQYIGLWIKRFLQEYLISIRNLSKNTQLSYRDTFRLLLPFTAMKNKKTIDKLLVEDLTPSIIQSFLLTLESKRNCSLSTRNQRLSAIHAFAKYVGINNPEYVEWCRLIQIIPLKKTKRTLITYLEKEEMDAILDAPDKLTIQGKRDYTLLLFLYNTGARADEVAQLTIADLSVSHSSKKSLATVLIKGKGGKSRRCPLWQQVVNEIKPLVQGREAFEHVFLNRLKQPLTRFGIHAMVKRYAKKAATKQPTIQEKKVSPHMIRYPNLYKIQTFMG